MKKNIEIGSFVRVALLTLVVEDIDGEFFFGTDSDGEEYDFRIDQIDAIL